MNGSHLINVTLGGSEEWRFVRVVVLIFSGAAVARLMPVRARAYQRATSRGRRDWFRPAYAVWIGGALALAVGAAGCAYGLIHAGSSALARPASHVIQESRCTTAAGVTRATSGSPPGPTPAMPSPSFISCRMGCP